MISELGEAKPGDRTMLDAIYPFVMSLKNDRYIGRATDGLAGYKQLYSPILLPAGRAVVRRSWKGVAKALCRDGRWAYALLHKITAYRVRAILR